MTIEARVSNSLRLRREQQALVTGLKQLNLELSSLREVTGCLQDHMVKLIEHCCHSSGGLEGESLWLIIGQVVVINKITTFLKCQILHTYIKLEWFVYF